MDENMFEAFGTTLCMVTGIMFGIEGGQGLQTSNINTMTCQEAPQDVTLSVCFQRKFPDLLGVS